MSINWDPSMSNDPYAPWNQEEGPCEVCGQIVDDCICPECTACGQIGDPTCYDGGTNCTYCGLRPAGFICTEVTCSSCVAACETGQWNLESFESHGMVRSPEQIAKRTAAEAEWKAQAEAESRFEEESDLEFLEYELKRQRGDFDKE